MEEVTFYNSKGQTLSGVFNYPDSYPSNMVIMSHGFLGDRDCSGIFIKAAEDFTKYGLGGVFRFDFGGSGKSYDTTITVSGQLDDLLSAIKHVRKKGFENLMLLGYSLGGLYSAMSYSKGIKTIVLWAPVTMAKTPTFFKDKEIQERLESNGYITLKNMDGKDHIVGKQYLKERLSIDQRMILSKIKCPVLIIHGDKDESVPVKHSIKAKAYLPEGSQLEIIKGGDHVFTNKTDTVISITLNWLLDLSPD